MKFSVKTFPKRVKDSTSTNSWLVRDHKDFRFCVYFFPVECSGTDIPKAHCRPHKSLGRQNLVRAVRGIQSLSKYIGTFEHFFVFQNLKFLGYLLNGIGYFNLGGVYRLPGYILSLVGTFLTFWILKS